MGHNNPSVCWVDIGTKTAADKTSIRLKIFP